MIIGDYGEETSSALEAGFKTSVFDRCLQLSVAGHYSDVTDRVIKETRWFIDSVGNKSSYNTDFTLNWFR